MLTIDDVLSIRHPDSPRWSPDGSLIAFSYTVDGRRELWTVGADGSRAAQAVTPGQAVATWDWAPDGRLTYAVGASLYARAPGSEALLIAQGQEPVGALRWSPDGQSLAMLSQGRLTLLGEGAPLLRALQSPGRVTTFAWAPDSARIALTFDEGREAGAAVIDLATGELLWRSQTADCYMTVNWVGSDSLTIVRCSLDSQRRDSLLLSLADGSEELLEREFSPKGLKGEAQPVVAPTGDAIAYTVIVDGWAHVVLRDLARGTRTVVLPGAHEDYSHAGDLPAFSPDGRLLALVSNKGALQQRQLWLYDRESGGVRQLTTAPGTNCSPVWSPDGAQIAYIAAGPWHSAEVALIEAAGGSGQLLTRSMPEAWERSGVVEPAHLTFPSAEGLEVHGDLFLPHGFDPARKYPAILYVHGGPMRQMRYGWHPMHAYAHFYSYNQYLLHQGYVILSVDYRGGTGYGETYEQANYLKFAQTELQDCVGGGRYLKGLSFVDAESVAIYGLSYGGYMTLAALTKYPDEFALGINLAGVWDFEQWAAWIEKQAPGYPNLFVARWGGPKSAANAEVYRQASPKHWAAQLRAPLLNLHGTADEAVDFAQLDAITQDLTEVGGNFASLYYPGETHLFHRRKTWEDALRRMDGAFARYLKCDPRQRPAAML